MQCASCQFENMPGSGYCARCGASLSLASADIDVHPPRASAWSRALPRWWRTRRLYYSLVNAAGDVFPSEMEDYFHPADFGLADYLRLAVPGFLQSRRDEKTRGRLFFWSFVGLLLLAIALAGTTIGSLFLGLAVAVHLSSVTDAVARHFASFQQRILFTIVAGVVLLGVLYLPAGWCLTRVATPVRVLQDMPPFQRGDVVWYNRSARLAAGELVLHQMPYTRLTGQTARGQAAQVVIQGQRIHRIVAEPGQDVEVREDQVLIDGKAPPWPADGLVRMAAGAKLRVDNGYYLVSPENLLPPGMQANLVHWRHISMVPRESIAGTVFLRTWPPHRLAWFD